MMGELCPRLAWRIFSPRHGIGENVKVKLEQNGWEKLTGRLAAMIAADPKIGRQSDLFAKRLRTRQAKAFARIEANPDSRAYRDYVLVPGRNSHD